MTSPLVSVIIPALNEESLLQELFEDFAAQHFREFEVIVADAHSTDNTRELALANGARVVTGGLPAAGRNAGARAAQGQFLFFLDADVRLDPYFIGSAYDEIQARFLDLATCPIVPLSDHPADVFLHDFTNLTILLGQFLDPHAPGSCVLVSKRLYERVGGFNQELKLAEDHDFVKRASAFRPLRVLQRSQIQFSVRRLEKEGRLNLAKKYLAVEFHRAFRGEIHDDIFDYAFGEFDAPTESLAPAKQKKRERFVALGQKMQASVHQEYLNYQQLLKEALENGQRIPEAQLEKLSTRFEALKQQIKRFLDND